MTASVIIPTLDAGNTIGTLLTALKSQTQPVEIIIVDSSSSDNTGRIASELGIRTETVRRSEFDHGGTRTMAARMSSGDFLIYMTQDALPSDERSIENLLRPFSNEEVGAAYGRQVPGPGASLFGAHSRLFNYPDKSSIKRYGDRTKFGIKTPFLSNSFAAYRRSAIEKVGWFRDGLISTEDTYAGAKLLLSGFAIAYVAEASVYHSHDYSVFQEFRRYFDIGVFHREEEWIRQTFGDVSGEGMKFVRSESEYLLRNRKLHLLPEFLVRNFLKYTAYALGRNYPLLPRGLRESFSMNRQWWRKGAGK